MLRAASIGLGWWSGELAQSIQGRSDKIQIVSCHSRSRDKCEAFAAKFDTAKHDSYGDVLADPKIDAVILTTPHSVHAEHVAAAASADKQVFVEKPFALTAETARRAAAKCGSAGVVLAVGHNRRFSSVACRLKKMVSDGDFGTLLHLEANFSAPGALAYTPDKWRANRIESPAGGIAGLGIHMIDLLCWLAGPMDFVHAQATRRSVTVDMDDTTSALFGFSDGPTGYLGCSFACAYNTTLNVYGTGANAFADIDGDMLQVQIPGGSRKEVEIVPIDTLRAELEEFALACAGEGRFRVSPDEAIGNVAVMEAIAESATARRPVRLEADAQAAWKESQK